MTVQVTPIPLPTAAAGVDVAAQEVLDVRGLNASFFTRRGEVRAVQDVSFSLARGETLAIVGESGSGKSATAMSILRMLPGTGQILGGEIIFNGDDLMARTERQMERIRGRQIGLIPQDPAASLNPLMTAGDHLTELLGVHLGLRGQAARNRERRTARGGGNPGPREPLPRLPAPALRWHAPARDDRARDCLPAGAAHRG